LDKDEVAPNNARYNAKVNKQIILNNPDKDENTLADFLKISARRVYQIRKENENELISNKNKDFSKETGVLEGKKPFQTPLT
jgi:hypothetical protein